MDKKTREGSGRKLQIQKKKDGWKRGDRRKQREIEVSMREKNQRKVIKKACHVIRKVAHCQY